MRRLDAQEYALLHSDWPSMLYIGEHGSPASCGNGKLASGVIAADGDERVHPMDILQWFVWSSFLER